MMRLVRKGIHNVEMAGSCETMKVEELGYVDIHLQVANTL